MDLRRPRVYRRSNVGLVLRLSSCFSGVIWFPYDVIMAKEKCGIDGGCTNLIFSTDDGCTRWWRWLHYFGRVIVDTQSRSPADKYAYMLYDCCQVWYAYTHLDCIRSTVCDIGNRHSMQVTHSYKGRIFLLFPPNSKVIYGWSDSTNLNCRWVQNIFNFQGMVIQFKIGQEWRVERRTILRLPGSLDHYSAPHYRDVIMSAIASQITGVLIVY